MNKVASGNKIVVPTRRAHISFSFLDDSSAFVCDACFQAVLTHGGFGYAKEHHVDRLLRRVTLTRGEMYFTIHLAASLRDIPGILVGSH